MVRRSNIWSKSPLQTFLVRSNPRATIGLSSAEPFGRLAISFGTPADVATAVPWVISKRHSNAIIKEDRQRREGPFFISIGSPNPLVARVLCRSCSPYGGRTPRLVSTGMVDGTPQSRIQIEITVKSSDDSRRTGSSPRIPRACPSSWRAGPGSTPRSTTPFTARVASRRATSR